jgi:5-methylcytosine-specific restriction endonuclease McrA
VDTASDLESEMSLKISTSKYLELRKCIREPIPEITIAAGYLDEAVSAHLLGKFKSAAELIRRADMPIIREWTDSLWGSNSPYVRYRDIANAPPHVVRKRGVKERSPTEDVKRVLLLRDGHHCRFCGIPLIRKEVRIRIMEKYPDVLLWKRKNIEQHAAFQAMWVQYDHIIPYARGGNSNIENMVITCAPCNYARMQYTLEEVGLIDPRMHGPVRSRWDGLERFK